MKSRHLLLTIPALLAAFAVHASGTHAGGHQSSQSIGIPGVAAKVTRTVNVEMSDDMRFSAAKIVAKQGETIRFIAKNNGKVKHEMVLGSEKELKEHYELMKKNPEMEHDEPNMVSVAPGQSGEIIWQFTKAGRVDFACLQPGHYEAGMKGLVNVAGTKAKAKAPTDSSHTH